MTTIRALIDGAWSPDRVYVWAAYDASGAIASEGVGRPSQWPSADRLEAVLAARLVRVTSVVLPPIAPERVAAAAGFAIEDDLAGPIDAQQVTTSAQSRDGRVRIVIVARDRIASLMNAAAPPFARIIAEPELALATASWRWCAPTTDGDGFVRLPDGSAFAVDAIGADGALPGPLAHAIAHGKRAGTTPSPITADLPVTAGDLARWSHETGTAFAPGTPWTWQRAPASAFAAAAELRPADARTRSPERGESLRPFRAGFLLLIVAMTIAIVASAGEWAWLRFATWQQARSFVDVAIAAGVPDAEASTPGAARTALARRHADARHAQGQAARSDALPLLARATPALSLLPPGAMKSAIYADNHWTIEIPGGDPAILRETESRLRQAGLPALLATSATGARLRFGIE